MRSQFSLRQLNPQDSQALGRLMENSPDTGRVNAAVHFEIDAFEAIRTMQGDVVGVVAETPGFDGIVGCCLARFGQFQFEGHMRPYALLNSLAVHPWFRRQGMASELLEWLVHHARHRLGDEGVIWGLMQQGNVGSERTAGKHLKQLIDGRILVIMAKPRSNPPGPTSKFTVRPAEPDEFEQVADQLNAFHRDFNFYEPETPASLASWCASTPFDGPFRHYLVVADSEGTIHAGAGVCEHYRLRTFRVRHMSSASRVLNALLRFVPSDGITQELLLSKIWFAPDQMQAAKHLWETIRWKWREKASLLVVWVDKRNPVLRVLNTRPWTPVTQCAVAIDSPVAASASRLIYYE